MGKIPIVNIHYRDIKTLENGFSNVGRVLSYEKPFEYDDTFFELEFSLKGSDIEEIKQLLSFRITLYINSLDEIGTKINNYINIISGGFIYNLGLDEILTSTSHNEYNEIIYYFCGVKYRLIQAVDIRETKFYTKSVLFGGIDKYVLDENFDWNIELINKLVEEGKVIRLED